MCVLACSESSQSSNFLADCMEYKLHTEFEIFAPVRLWIDLRISDTFSDSDREDTVTMDKVFNNTDLQTLVFCYHR
jgi:hypothetical protein